MANTCSSCDFVNPPGMRFCGNCGARLEAQPATIPPAAMIGGDLMERFRQAGLEARGQRRSVTILFADITGFTTLSSGTDSEAIFEMIRKFTRLLASDVYRYEGMVDKFTGDGLMALFGAPIAHENNAELAVRSALDMLLHMDDLNQEFSLELRSSLRLRIGLNAGEVTVGSIGSDLLMNYTAIGNTVNLAQRLMDAAHPGSILASQEVYKATRHLFEYEIVPDLSLKNIPEKVAAYRLTGQISQPTSARGLEGIRSQRIGRLQEMNLLNERINQLLVEQTGQMAIVTGEAGIGKSRLVSDLLGETRQKPVTILQGNSLLYRRDVAYWLFQDILRNYLHASVDTPLANLQEKLRGSCGDLMAERAGEVLPYLENLLHLPISEPNMAARVELLDASQLRQQIFLAVRAWLTTLASLQPVVLMLEDLHWADDTSLELLDYLLPSLASHPLGIIGISRPFSDGPLKKAAAWAESNLRGRYCLVSLQSLTRQESEELLRGLTDIRNLPQNMWEKIISQSSGVPFYLEEILRMMIDQGSLVRVEDHWEFNDTAAAENLGVPSTLQGLILARFDRLNAEQRQVLQAATVIGHQFNLQVLKMILPGVPERDLVFTLSSMVEREFIYEDSETPGLYNFRQAMVAEAVYSTLLRRDRAILHGLVAEAIEKFYLGQLDRQVEILARHFSWSDRKDRALHYLILAAQRAARSYINGQARTYYEEAQELTLQVGHTNEQLVQINGGLGDVLLLIGEYDAARQRFRRALELTPAEKIEERSTLLRKIGTVCERQGNYEEALRSLDQAHAALSSSPDAIPVEHALVLNDTGWIQFRQGKITEAENNLLTALQLAEQTTRFDVGASIYNRLGGIFWQRGDLEGATNCVQKSLTLREEIGDTAGQARSYNNLGLLNWMRGRWENALENFAHCLELQATLGDIEGIITVRGNLGLLQLDRGDFESAQHHFSEALGLAQQVGHNYLIAQTYGYFCKLYYLNEGWQRALDYGNLSMRMFQEMGAEDEMAMILEIMGIVYLDLGLPDQARKMLELAESIFEIPEEAASEGSQNTESNARILRLRAHFRRAGGQIDEAETLFRQSIAIFSAIGSGIEQQRTALNLARLLDQRGRKAQARILLKEARLIFHQLGARHDLRKLESISSQIL